MLWSNLSVLMPVGFVGVQSGIGSWFRANNSIDSTNGHSWCGYPYQDWTPGFAIDMAQMAQGGNPQWPDPLWAPTAKAWCGLEAKIYCPATGETLIGFMIDAFDHKWVRSNGSIDIMLRQFESLQRSKALDKNKVLQVQWEFTGVRNPQYQFGGIGDFAY